MFAPLVAGLSANTWNWPVAPGGRANFPLLTSNFAIATQSVRFARTDYVEQVILRERPSGILLAFGGQTALNCGIELNNRGIFTKHNVRVLGTAVQAIVDTEDREIFSTKLAEIGESCVPNIPCFTMDEVVAAAHKIGFPVMMRASFALGGLGSGVVADEPALREQAQVAFANSNQVSGRRGVTISNWAGIWIVFVGR